MNQEERQRFREEFLRIKESSCNSGSISLIKTGNKVDWRLTHQHKNNIKETNVLIKIWRGMVYMPLFYVKYGYERAKYGIIKRIM